MGSSLIFRRRRREASLRVAPEENFLDKRMPKRFKAIVPERR
jgi:hypothetical protein